MITNISSRLLKKYVLENILKHNLVLKNIFCSSYLEVKKLTFLPYPYEVASRNANCNGILCIIRCNSNISADNETEGITRNQFESLCSETLDSLCEYFEEVVEAADIKGCDVTYSDGVLTVHLGPQYGTYVINRQSPNHQIWLSSPTSGPKRYDYNTKEECWIYRHDNKTLHELLQEEIPEIIKIDTDFFSCSLGKRKKQ